MTGAARQRCPSAARAAAAAFGLLCMSGCSGGGDLGAPIEPAELAQRIREGSAPRILDVRTAEEYAAGHIPGAINVPHIQLATRLDAVRASKSDEIVVHCHSGRRAAHAEFVLLDAGYSNVRDLSGHMKAWQEAGLPVE